MRTERAVPGLGAYYTSCCPLSRVCVCVCVFVGVGVCLLYMILRIRQSCLIAKVSPFSSPLTPPLHLCITSTIKFSPLFCYFSPPSLPPSLSLTYSAPPGMIECQNTHRHTAEEPYVQMDTMSRECAWT